MKDDRNDSPAERPDADPVARLVRLASLDGALSEDARERLRETTRPHWQRAVARQRRRSQLARPGAVRLIAAAGVAALLVGGLLLASSHWADAVFVRPIARVVAIDRGNGIEAAPRLIRTSESIATQDQRWVLELLGEGVAGTSVRLDRETELFFRRDGGMQLLRGAIYVDTRGPLDRAISVYTPHIRAVDVGTQFEVRLVEEKNQRDEEVYVRKGAVEVTLLDPATDETGPAWAVFTGERLELPAGTEQPLIDVIAASASRWSWVSDLASARSFDGRPLRELVAWSAHELGLEVHTEDGEAAKAVQEATVFGDVLGLRPKEALDTALAVSGLFATVDDGTLLIRARGKQGGVSP